MKLLTLLDIGNTEEYKASRLAEVALMAWSKPFEYLEMGKLGSARRHYCNLTR
jgi:hypothetical protein